MTRHFKEKRPRLAAVLGRYNGSMARLLETGCVPDDLDPEDVATKMKEALAADQKGAFRDKSIWASMDWKWQEYPLNRQ